MTSVAAELAILLSAKDVTGPAVRSAVGNLEKLEDVSKSSNKAFGGLAGAIQQGIGIFAGMRVMDTVSNAISGAAQSAIGFEKSLSGIKAVSGATQQEMSQLSALALQLGKDTSFSASEASKGIEELIKGGVSIADVFGGAAAASLNLAAAGEIDLGSAASIAANAMNVFGLQGADMAKVSNLIAGAANATTIGVNDFKLSLSAVGSVANLAGQSFDSTAVAIAAMGQAGIMGSDAGTSLKAMLNTLIPTTDAATAMMRDLGIITADGANKFIDSSGKMRDFGSIAETLQTALGGLTESQRLLATEVIFGSDGMRAAGILAKEGGEGFDALSEAMSKVTAEAVAAQRLDNVAGDIEQLKGSAETAGIVLLSELSPALRDVTQKATGFVNTFTNEAQTIIRTAENISSARGIGLIDAAIIAVENRLRETWGPAWADGFHAAKQAVDDTAEVVKGAATWLNEHRETVRLVTEGYAAWAGVQGIGAVISMLPKLKAAIMLVSPELVALGALALGTNAIFAKMDNVGIDTIFERQATNLHGFVGEIGETLKLIPKWVGDLVQEAKQNWVLFVHSVQEVANTIGPTAATIGAAIVQGVINGITGGSGKLVSAAFALGAQAIAAIRNAVDSHSPSVEAMEIGQAVSEGLAIGIENLAPVAEEAAAAMADAVMTAAEKATKEGGQRVEDAERDHQRRMADLREELGGAKTVDDRTRINEQIQEAQRDHGRKLEDLEIDLGRRLETIRQDESEKAAELHQQRLDMVADFNGKIEDLTEELAEKSQEINDRAAAGIAKVWADLGDKIGDESAKLARDSERLAEDLVRKQGVSSGSFVTGQGREKEDFDTKRERTQEDAAADRLKLVRDTERAETDEQRARARERLAEFDETLRTRLAREDEDFRTRQARALADIAEHQKIEREDAQLRLSRMATDAADRITVMRREADQRLGELASEQSRALTKLAGDVASKAQTLADELAKKLGPAAELAMNDVTSAIVNGLRDALAAVRQVAAEAGAGGTGIASIDAAVEQAKASGATLSQQRAALLNAGTATNPGAVGYVPAIHVTSVLQVDGQTLASQTSQYMTNAQGDQVAI